MTVLTSMCLVMLWCSLCVAQAGHAVAAAAEGVGVQHVGAFTLLLLPGAYVALDSGALATLGPWRTLRVCPLPFAFICESQPALF